MDDRLNFGRLLLRVAQLRAGAPQVGPLLRPGRRPRATARRRREAPFLRPVNIFRRSHAAAAVPSKGVLSEC